MDQDPDTSYSEDAASSTDNQDNICNVEEYNDVAAKQRASVLWLLSKAYMPKIPSELYDPCYVDHEGNERLKPQIVHALANAELYCLALANIYADPNYHNLNHHGILQVLMRKGIEIIEPTDTTLTETVMVQTAPIRMSAHMVVIEGIMALFVKEVLIPEKVMEVVSRYAMVNPESELPYDSEEAALLWVNKSCIKLRHRIEDQLMNFHSSEGPNSSPTRKFRPPMIAPAQDLGDLSDGCCLSALLSLYCPKYFHWQDIRLNDPLSLADSVHNLQMVQKFCHEHLPQDVFCLTLEDLVYLHPSILPNVLTLIADLMYIFEIRPPKHICRPGYEEENRISEDFTYSNVNGQSPVPNCKRQSTQRSASPSHELESLGSNDDTGSMSPQTSNGTWQKLQKSSSRRMVASEGRAQDSKRPYDSGCEIQTSHQNYPAEEDDELAGYFSPQHHSPSQSLLDQDDNRRTKHQQSVEDAQQTHYKVFHATNPLKTDYSSGNDRRKGGSKSESREIEPKATIKKSPSSYEIHQLSPSKQSMGKQLQGYSRQRSQSELDIPQERKQIAAGNRISYSEIEETQMPNKMAHKTSMEGRRNRNSFHEMPRYNTLKENEKPGKFSMPRRNNSDFFLHERQDMETRTNRLSGSQTWRKPKDLFARTEFLEEAGDHESGNGSKNQDCDQENIMSFANLSKHRNDSGSSINIVYTNQDRDQISNTYKKATRPGYLHISPSQKSIPSSSPTSATKVNNWVTDNSRNQQEDMDGAIASQMIDIRLQLEEKRKKIEQEKQRLEAMTKKQREKVGKAAFLQAVKNSNMYDSAGRGRNFSVDDLTEDLDSVRRKWLEKRCEQDADMDDREQESPSEDFQNSIEQLNCNLSDLQSDISRLTQQQETIQNMLRGSGQTPHQTEAYFLHDGNTPQQQQEPSRWAEPMQHSNTMYKQPQQPQQQPMPAQEVPHVGRGHWGQPVIPFSNLQPPPQLQNTSNWQQSSPMYPGRPSSVEPQMMSGQHMNMQHPMYDSPQFPGGIGPQRFSMHPQQQQPPNFGMHMQPPNTYSNDQMQNFYPNQYPGQYSNMYQQPNFNVMQNTYGGGVQNPPAQSQYPNAGFHLHRSPSANYITNREYAGSPNQPGRHFSQTEPMQIPRSLSKADVSYTLQENSGPVTDEFGRLPKNSALQNSPPNRPMLGKTFRVSKPKLASPLSPSQNQTTPIAQDSEQTQETVPPVPSPPPPPATSSSSTEKKGFYISFDEADLPKKPKPKLKPKHLKARSQQKKMDRESEIDSARDNQYHIPENIYQTHRKQAKENDAEALEDRFGNVTDTTEENESNIDAKEFHESSRAPPVSKAPGVGFVIGTETVQPDPDKELEMTRRKEMIMMMSLRRRAEQEAKRNQKQQEYMMKREEERMKSEQMERKKEEEKLRRQLILEQYRQRKAADEDDGPPGGRDDYRPAARGTPVTRPKSSFEELQGFDKWIGGKSLSSSSLGGKPDVKSKSFVVPSAVLLLSYGILMGTRSASVTRSKPKSGPMSSGRTHELSSPSSLDSPVGKGSQYNLSSGYHDDVSSEHSYTPSPRRSQNYPHSSPISPSSYPSSPGPLLPGLLSSSNRSRGTPSDGLSDTSSTISSAWASEYTGPKLFVKPSTKSNRGIITNAINTVLAGAVNADTKRKVLEEIDRSDGKHFLILFRDAGCQFRALYSYNPETEEVLKMFGIGPRVISNKMMDRFYKYNSGGKSFTQIHTKHLTATIDAFTIQNSLWQSKKMVPLKRDYL